MFLAVSQQLKDSLRDELASTLRSCGHALDVVHFVNPSLAYIGHRRVHAERVRRVVDSGPLYHHRVFRLFRWRLLVRGIEAPLKTP